VIASNISGRFRVAGALLPLLLVATRASAQPVAIASTAIVESWADGPSAARGVVHRLAATLPASAPATDAYAVPGEMVPLRRADTDVVVRLDRTATAAVAQEVVDRALASSARHRATTITVRDHGRDRTGQGWFRVTASDALDDRDVSAIRGAPGVDYVGHVFVNARTGRSLVLTDQLVVTLRAGAGGIDALNQRLGTITIEPVFGSNRQFVVRVPDAGPRSALDVANALAADPEVEWAQPDFLQDLTRFFTPNDPLFGNQWHLNNTGQSCSTSAGMAARSPSARRSMAC